MEGKCFNKRAVSTKSSQKSGFFLVQTTFKSNPGLGFGILQTDLEDLYSNFTNQSDTDGGGDGGARGMEVEQTKYWYIFHGLRFLKWKFNSMKNYKKIWGDVNSEKNDGLN